MKLRMICASLGGALLLMPYSFSALAAISLLLYAFWHSLGDLALSLFEGSEIARSRRELKKTVHADVDGFYVLLDKERRWKR